MELVTLDKAVTGSTHMIKLLQKKKKKVVKYGNRFCSKYSGSRWRAHSLALRVRSGAGMVSGRR